MRNRYHQSYPAILLGLLIVLSGCQSVKLAHVQYDPKADFSKARNFAWIGDRSLSFHPLESVKSSASLEKSLQDNTAGILTQRGLQFVTNRDEADIVISFSVGARKQPTAGFRYPPAVSGDILDYQEEYWPGSSMEDIEYLDGQICVYIHQISDGQTIWHGTVRDIQVNTSEDIFEEEVVEEILGRILENFPPDPALD